MKLKNLYIVFFALVLCILPGTTAKQAFAANELVIADFNTGEKPNNIGGDFGSWDKDPSDETQGCKMSFESDDANGKTDGYSVHLN